MPTPSAITGSVATFIPIPQHNHQRLTEDRRNTKWYQCYQDGPPIAESDKTQCRDRKVNIDHHRAVCSPDNNVGRCFYPGTPGRKKKFAICCVVLSGKILNCFHHAVECFRLVIRQISTDRHD